SPRSRRPRARRRRRSPCAASGRRRPRPPLRRPAAPCDGAPFPPGGSTSAGSLLTVSEGALSAARAGGARPALGPRALLRRGAARLPARVHELGDLGGSGLGYTW